MGRLDVRRLAWGINRWFLVHGVLAWVAAVGAALLLASLVLLVASARHHAALEARLAGQSGTAVATTNRGKGEPRLPFPAYAERFELTARTLDALRIDESLPGKIAFRYDRDPDAGLVRQTATLNVTSRWQGLGALLDRAQTTIPTAYISRLQISRDSYTDQALVAEVQFTLVFRDSPQGGAE